LTFEGEEFAGWSGARGRNEGLRRGFESKAAY